ncbi:hypothetical protein D9M68_792410 [compost metagenome]
MSSNNPSWAPMPPRATGHEAPVTNQPAQPAMNTNIKASRRRHASGMRRPQDIQASPPLRITSPWQKRSPRARPSRKRRYRASAASTSVRRGVVRTDIYPTSWPPRYTGVALARTQ